MGVLRIIVGVTGSISCQSKVVGIWGPSEPDKAGPSGVHVASVTTNVGLALFFFLIPFGYL